MGKKKDQIDGIQLNLEQLKVEQIIREWDIIFNGKLYEAFKVAQQKEIDKFIDSVLDIQDGKGQNVFCGVRR